MGRRRSFAAVLFPIAVAASGGPARAAEPVDAGSRAAARALFAQGVKLNEAGDTTGALAAFRAAYDKSPSYRVLYNIGQLCARTGDAPCAMKAYEKYLLEGGSDVSAKRRTEVEAELQKLRRSVASITVRIPTTGADIAIDDQASGKSPLPDPIVVMPGLHKVSATLDGRSADTKINAAGGEATTVDLEIPPPPPPPPPPAAAGLVAAPEPAATKPLAGPLPRSVPVVPWVVTGTLAVATLVTAVLTESKYSAYTDKRESFPTTKGELVDAQSSARTLFIATGALGALTVVSAVVAGYFTWVARKGAGPRVGLGPGGVTVAGGFR